MTRSFLLIPLMPLIALAAPAAAPAPAAGQDASEIRAAVRAQTPAALALYRELLRLPNDAHHPDDIARVLAWVERAFEERGFRTERLPTRGADLLLAERPAPGATRTVLVYLQADGQPVDPSRWDQESPYEPVLKRRGADDEWETIPWQRLDDAPDDEGRSDWRIFARSAADSKGPVAQLLSAFDALPRLGGAGPDFNLKVIVDAEEEMGSPNLPDAVRRFRDRLAADRLVIFDGPPHDAGEPTLKFGARGIATFTLTTYGPRAPQHSGHYGNYVPNPAIRLAEILVSMKDDRGRVTIPGWYDGIRLDADTRAILARVPDDEVRLMRELGIAGRDSIAPTLQESLQYPSLNVRGMRSGWVGDEARTIIPATATAEVDVRLVAETDGERMLDLVRRHIESLGYHLVDGEPTEEERARHPRLASFRGEVSYAAFRTALDSEPDRWLTAALTRLNGAEPIRIRTSGGSIPISPFVETLGIPAVTVPTVNPDNNQHSPNENLRVGSFVEGIATMLAVLTEPL
ncbi:MAG TPA: M20/M25/M40 family metallo-hydrolase [Gemmatimonadota bacterium]|nr:M20/M25/M40 family metallo-hydrolase [Gemmatimonadota bacterium]